MLKSFKKKTADKEKKPSEINNNIANLNDTKGIENVLNISYLRVNHDLEYYGFFWKNLLEFDETEALNILSLCTTIACQPTLVNHTYQSELIVKNFDHFVIFLNNITELSDLQTEKIVTLIIELMDHKIFDLIAVHFEKQTMFAGRDNSLIAKIMKYLLLSNESYKNYIINCIKPITKIIYSGSITIKPLIFCNTEIFLYTEDNIDSLVPAFEKSIINLLTVENYPPEIQKIILDFSKNNKKVLLSYLILNFINPVILNYADNSNNEAIKIWCYNILVATLEALTSLEKIENPKIHPYLIDLVSVNKPYQNQGIRNKVNEVITKKLDPNKLIFQPKKIVEKLRIDLEILHKTECLKDQTKLLNNENNIILSDDLKTLQQDFQQSVAEYKNKFTSNAEIVNNIGIFSDSKSINSTVNMSISTSPREKTSTDNLKNRSTSTSPEFLGVHTLSITSNASSESYSKRRAKSVNSSHSLKTHSKEKTQSFNSNSILNQPMASTIKSNQSTSTMISLVQEITSKTTEITESIEEKKLTTLSL